jgi:hypothetical protein
VAAKYRDRGFAIAFSFLSVERAAEQAQRHGGQDDLLPLTQVEAEGGGLLRHFQGKGLVSLAAGKLEDVLRHGAPKPLPLAVRACCQDHQSGPPLFSEKGTWDVPPGSVRFRLFFCFLEIPCPAALLFVL